MDMGTTVQRTSMVLNLPVGLVAMLNKEAENKHKTLDDFMEEILSKISLDDPNKETREAFHELQSGRYAGKLDMSSYAMFMKSVESIK